MEPRRRRRNLRLCQPRPQLSLCANCSSPCVNVDDSDHDKLVREIPIVNANENSEQQSIKVYDVLSSIYKLDYLHQLKLIDHNNITEEEENFLLSSFKKRDKSNNNNSNISHDDGDDTTSVGVCSSCAENLTYLYNYYLQFTLVASLNSYLSTKIKKLDDAIHHLQIRQKPSPLPSTTIREEIVQNEKAEINNEQQQLPSCDPLDEEDQPIPNCDNDDKQQQPHPNCDDDNNDSIELGTVKLESLDEDDLCDNYDDLDNADYNPSVSTEDKTDDQEKDSDETISSEKLIIASKTNDSDRKSIEVVVNENNFDEATSTTVKVNKISGPSPIIKLCALTESEIAAATSRKRRRHKHVKYNEDDTLNDDDRDGGGGAEEEFDATQLTKDDHDWTCRDSDKDEEDDSDFTPEDSEVKKKEPKPKPPKIQKISLPKRHIDKTTSSSSILKSDAMKNPTDSPSSPKTCPLCEQERPSAFDLVDHILTTHLNKEKPQSCPICAKEFKRQDSLRNHVRDHAGFITHPCPDCSRVYRHRCPLQVHVKMKHSKKLEHRCHTCSASFSDRTSRMKHVYQHRPHPCTKCRKRYKNPDDLERHVRQSHENKQQRLERERQEERDGKQRTSFQKCPSCKKKVLDLEDHFLTCTPPTFGYKCDVCDFLCGTSSGLKQHKNRHEGKIMPHLCSQCGRTFSSAGVLTRHMTIHTGEKPHICDVCGKGFRLQLYLREHIRTHTNVKAHLCSECGMALTTSGGLKRHMQCHTGILPHVCKICSERFPDLRPLKKHMKTHETQNEQEEID